MGYNPLRRYRGGKAMDVGLFFGVIGVLAVLVFWATK